MKHSVLICRMKTVLKSSIAIIEIEHLSLTPMSVSSGNLVDLDCKEGWLTLMFPETIEMTQWLKDPFPDHSPAHGLWSSNQGYSPAKHSAPGTLVFLKMLNQQSSQITASDFNYLKNQPRLILPIAGLPVGYPSCIMCASPRLRVLGLYKSAHSSVTERWQSTGKERLREEASINGLNVNLLGLQG